MLRLAANPATNASEKKAQEALKNILKRNDLGFWQLPNREQNWIESSQIVQELKQKFERLIILGMGGSSFGGRAIVEALSETPHKTFFIYNSDPYTFCRFLEKDWRPESDGWLIISKSGTTIEILTQVNVLVEELEQRNLHLSKYIHVITEPTNNPLHKWATETKISVTAHPLDVGGRFSALTPVGLIPAGFSGVPIMELRDGANWILQRQALVSEFSGLVLDRLAQGEAITVFWSYVDRLNMLLPWIEQLWAESLGKKEDVMASSPMLSYGTAYQHSVLQQYMEGRRDKFFVFFQSEDVKSFGSVIKKNNFHGWDWLENRSLGEIFHAEAVATEKALRQKERSTAVLSTQTINARTLGAYIMFFELVVATVGEALGVNPFDQPGVELGKKLAREILNG
jgi:glucose-6-phosphate isomerase